MPEETKEPDPVSPAPTTPSSAPAPSEGAPARATPPAVNPQVSTAANPGDQKPVASGTAKETDAPPAAAKPAAAPPAKPAAKPEGPRARGVGIQGDLVQRLSQPVWLRNPRGQHLRWTEDI